MRRDFETRAEDAIMNALKERAGAASKHAEARRQENFEPRPEPKQEFDLERAMDEVMTRFPEALEYLGR